MQRESAVTAEPPAAQNVEPHMEKAALGMRTRAGHEARRVRHGLRRPANWFQLVRFGIVGFTGYVINLLVYSILVEAAEMHYLPAAVLAFCVAVSNNFLLNRHWTFGGGGATGFQAPRFLAISVGSLIINLIALELLVTVADFNELPAQALAVAIAMPFNFIGNKVWTFSWETYED
jgi:putative flippase GtrA